MSTHNIKFHDKIKQNLKNIHRKNSLETQTRVRVTHGKRVIGVRVIEVLL